MSEEKEQKEARKSGSHKDNDLSDVQKVMKDNDLPFYHSKDDDDGDGKHTTH